MIDPRPEGLCLTHERDQRVPPFRVVQDAWPAQKRAMRDKEIRELKDQGLGTTAIARKIGVSENTVRTALAKEVENDG